MLPKLSICRITCIKLHDMLVYILLVSFSLFMSIIYDNRSSKAAVLPYIILYILVVLVAGLRYRVGIDTLNYMEIYSTLPDVNNIVNIFDSEENYTIAPLFLFLVVISKLFSNEFFVLQIFHAAILNFFIFLFVFREKRNKFFCIFMYLIAYFFYFNMEIMRESLAVGVFLMSRDLLYNRKYIKYLLCVIIASMFHYSALIMIIYPFVLNLRLNKNICVIISLSVFLFVFMKPIVSALLYNLESGFLVNKVINYMEFSESQFSNKVYLLQLIKYTLLPLSVLFLYNKYYGGYFKYESLVIFHILLGIGSVFYQIIFARFTNYTLPYVILLYAEFIFFSYRKLFTKNRICVVMSLCILFVILFDYGIRPVVDARNYNKWIPYYSIFNPQRDNTRESIWVKSFE